MNRPPKTKLVVALGGALLALSALSATTAFAAGLGKLNVISSLGQPLSAEIELVSLQPGEFESIAARIASPESYGDAKIEYSPLLRQLRFAVERRSDGKPVVKITSNAPINEPFLDVLVEMNWPAGRLLREYPILLDPPGFSEARVAPPVATVAAVKPPVATAVEPAASAPATGSSAASAAAVAAPVAAVTTGTPSAKAESGGSGDTYGPVKRGDTLSKIAAEMKTDTVSLEQMLVALYRENQSAFIGNNMNRLRTGQILKVPSASDVAAVAETDARKEIKLQVASWKEYRDQVAGSAAASTPAPAVAEKPSNQVTGKVTVAKPEVTTPAAAPKDQLKIAKTDAAGGKTGGAGASGTGNLQDQVNALKEEKTARENALKEANSRVADLEKTIVDMKKLAELKGLAAKAADTKVAQVTPPPVKAPEPVKAAEPAKTIDAKTPDIKPADTKPGDTKVADAKPADAKPGDAKPAEAKPVDVKPAPPKVPVKAPPPPPPPEPNFLEDNMVAIGAGGAALLGAGGLFSFMARRRKKSAGGNSTGMSSVSSVMPSDMKPNSITGNRGGGLVDTGNSSFLTDFDKTGPGSIDTDEVDPVAEAEVYIAYGRDAQAEEILKEAMSRDKSRHEITVKLLEIYHARKSAPAFETVARELKDAIGGDNPMWAKVAAMGASIDPQNSLYSGSGAAYATTGAFSAGGATTGAAEADKAPPDVDFDLGFTESASTTPAPISAFDVTSPNSDQPAGGASFDLDLNTGSGTDTSASDLGGGLDFDLALDVPSAPAAPSASSAPAEAPSSFDFDLSSLSLDSGDTIKSPPPAEKPSGMPSLSDLSLDLEVPGGGGGGEGSVATKLELAKAYIEIGDSEGAKEILTEVSREGSAAQQAEAKKILAGM